MWVTSGAPFHEPGDGVWYVAAPGAKPCTSSAARCSRSASRGSATGSTWSPSSAGAPGSSTVSGLRRQGVQAPPPRDPVDPGLPAPAGVDRAPDRTTACTSRSAPSWRGRRPAGTSPGDDGGPFRRDGGDLRVEAKTTPSSAFGLAFIPAPRRCWLADDGRDDLGAAPPARRAEPGPRCHEGRGPTRFPSCARRGRPLLHDDEPAAVALPPPLRARRCRHGEEAGAAEDLTAFVALNGAVYPGVNTAARSSTSACTAARAAATTRRRPC